VTGAGALRHRLVLERPDDAPDGAGGVVAGWTAAATVWGAIAPVRADEAVAAGRLDGLATHRVEIRHRGDVAGGWRVRTGGRTLRVRAALDPDERRRRLVLVCEEEGR
jgi:SPP1 family predicted phage head-tail adaptor